MKGLLLKDWYALWSYLRIFLIVELGFVAMAIFTDANAFFLLYPCILSGMLSMTLIAYEEKEKWNIYALTLPYSRAQLVSSKYLVSLFLALSVVALATASQLIAMLLNGAVDFRQILGQITLMLPLSLIPSALLLPFVYKFGAEKGRIAYYLVIGIFCAVLSGLGAFQGRPLQLPEGELMIVLILLASWLIYAISWLLSVKFYEKREL